MNRAEDSTLIWHGMELPLFLYIFVFCYYQVFVDLKYTKLLETWLTMESDFYTVECSRKTESLEVTKIMLKIYIHCLVSTLVRT